MTVRRRRTDRRSLHCRSGGSERRNRLQQPFPMSEHHPELLKVDVGQLGQNLGINGIVAKRHRVLLQLQVAQPLLDVHVPPPWWRRGRNSLTDTLAWPCRSVPSDVRQSGPCSESHFRRCTSDLLTKESRGIVRATF